MGKDVERNYLSMGVGTTLPHLNSFRVKKYNFIFGSDINCKENIEHKSLSNKFCINKTGKTAALMLISKENKMHWKSMQKIKKTAKLENVTLIIDCKWTWLLHLMPWLMEILFR